MAGTIRIAPLAGIEGRMPNSASMSAVPTAQPGLARSTATEPAIDRTEALGRKVQRLADVPVFTHVSELRRRAGSIDDELDKDGLPGQPLFPGADVMAIGRQRVAARREERIREGLKRLFG